MDKKPQKILTEIWDRVDPWHIESYLENGGYEALKKALLEMSPEEAIAELKKSGLQGRGGAGFPTGDKWEIVGKIQDDKYFICNLNESEPGVFKDRIMAEKNPHQILEGIIIGAYAVGAKKAYLYLNGKFKEEEMVFKHAISEAYKKNILGERILGSNFNLGLELYFGPGVYICGEETALINSMEGKRGEPRMRPPYPVNCGLFGKPTVVNNAETLANVSWIIRNSGEKYSQIGLKESPGMKFFSIDGAVKNPGLYEAPIGMSVRELIDNIAGGATGDFWFAQIGGSSGNLVTKEMLNEVPSFSREAKIHIGSGSILVVDKNQDIKRFLRSIINFFQRESCGKCVPCREGTFRLKSIVGRLVSGDFDQNDKEDLGKIIHVLDNATFCPLGKFSVVALKDMIKYKIIEELVD